MRKVLTAVGLVAVSALALGACGGDDDAGNELGDKIVEDLVDDATDGSVNVDDGEVTFEGEDGEGSFTVGGGELADELADFPLPDDTEVISSYSGSSGDGTGGSVVSVAANGDYEEVAADIQGALEDDGFTISGTYNAESNGIGTATFTFEGDGMTGTVSVMEDSSTEGFNLLITIMTSEDTSTSEG